MPSSGTTRTLQARRAAARRYGHSTTDLDRAYATEKIAEYIKRVVDGAPPLTEEQRARLMALLAPQGVGARARSF